MDTQKLFRQISEQMAKDFEISASINHSVNKGAYRESALSKFLSNGRLPARYAIGSGEIVAPTNETSRQSDLIIFNALDGISLLYDENVQVYPVECVYGVIEVKSTLTKEKLLEALENIKSVKELSTDELVTKEFAPGFRTNYKRAKPFGAIFAYSLGKNSLESLAKNLVEWEAENKNSVWPNIIAVLGEGVITHYTAEALQAINNKEINTSVRPISFSYKEDTLFRFYASILDLCSSTELAPTILWRYFDKAEKISGLRVRRHDRLTSEDGRKVKLTEDFIMKVHAYCQSIGSITNADLMIKRFGTIPEGMAKLSMESSVFFYNPDNFPGIHQIDTPTLETINNLMASKLLIDPCICITINETPYYVPMAYITDQDVTVL